MIGVVAALSLVAGACGGDSDTADTEASSDTTAAAEASAATTAAGAAATTAAAKAETEEGGTYAIVLPSSKTDKSFSQAGFEGLEAGVKTVGGETIFQENVQVASAEEAFRNLASQKPVAVIGLGGQFADAGAAVAPEFPDVHFIVVNGTKTGPNLSKWSLAEGEVAYLAGLLAAAMNPDLKKLGRVGGLEIAPLKFGTSGFILGARSVRPDIEYVWSFTGDFDDVAKAKEATLAAINGGAEIVYTGMNNAIVGQEQAAEEKGVLLINNTFNKCDDAKVGKLYFGATSSSATFAVKGVVEGIGSGKLKPGFAETNLNYPDGFKVDVCGKSVPADVQAKVDAAKADLVAGKIAIPLEPPK